MAGGWIPSRGQRKAIEPPGFAGAASGPLAVGGLLAHQNGCPLRPASPSPRVSLSMATHGTNWHKAAVGQSASRSASGPLRSTSPTDRRSERGHEPTYSPRRVRVLDEAEDRLAATKIKLDRASTLEPGAGRISGGRAAQTGGNSFGVINRKVLHSAVAASAGRLAKRPNSVAVGREAGEFLGADSIIKIFKSLIL